MPRETFRELFEAHEGKSSDKWDSYLDVYEEIFAPLRDQPISLLEFGVQNGGSLEISRQYFSRAKVIVGVDIDPRCATLSFHDERISVVIGDAKTAKTRGEIARYSALFDVIIDDGSHISSDIIATFLQVVPLLADNGVYVVEDMHASYWKEFGGELFAPYSAAAFFKTLTDVLNYEHWSLNKPPADLLQPFAEQTQVPLPINDLERIESITFLNSMCVIKKTAGNRTMLGLRRIAGTQSDITKVERFPIEAYARRNELNSPEDSFWAWQPRPPMEMLAAKVQLVNKLERQVAEHDQSIIEHERESGPILDSSKRLIVHQSQRLLQLRNEVDSLNEQLAQLYDSSSWRITYPLRITKAAYRRIRSLGRRLLTARLLSGETRNRKKLLQSGVFFHLDQPLGIIVPRRRKITFRGWAVDTITKGPAEIKLFADGQMVPVVRYKREDVTVAFRGQISESAKAAFEITVPLSRRSTWVRLEVRAPADEWILVHRAFLALLEPVDEGDLRPERSYDPTEWLKVIQSHLKDQIGEMTAHMNAMVRRPNFVVVIDARKNERKIDVTLASLGAQIYQAARILVLRDPLARELEPTGLGLEIESRHAICRINKLDLCDPGLSSMDYIFFLEPGDQLWPSALYSIASVINREPNSSMIYTDELFWTSSGSPLPFHKPSWSPDYLESFNYVGHSAAYSIARARDLSLPFISLYDFILRFTENLDPDCVLHLDQLLIERAALFTQNESSTPDTDAIQARLERTGRSGTIITAASGINCYHARVSWDRTPRVSIIIPTAGYIRDIDGRKVDLIINITRQIVERSTYRSAEIIVVDNGHLNETQRSQLIKLGCRTVTFDEPTLNIAKKLNLGASRANGEFLLLMNDDMEIIQEDWIERLCDHFAKPEVGVVGCKLLYPNRTTQHVGVIQYHGNPDHVRRGYPAADAGYFNSTCGVRNYLAVTGACMLTRQILYKQVGGYSPKLAVSYNDADYCLKVRKAGYRVVYTGDVAVIHMESLSRAPSADPDEVRYYQETWTTSLPSDPFYNERFLELAPPSFEPRTNDRLL